ncbi:sodium channel regulatory subunit beta-2 isoform 2-T2 [Spinachia spinachia]
MSSPAQERRTGVQLLSAAMLLLSSGCSSMDVIMPNSMNALNGTTIKIPCTFTSCYKMDPNMFVMNWTYQETLNDTEEMIEDEGIYNCNVRNPPDRITGQHGIQLNVVTELPPPRDSTIAVAIGASVGGALALLILSMLVVKCLRRHRKKELISEEKMEEEEKLDAEVVAEEGNKHKNSLPEDL